MSERTQEQDFLGIDNFNSPQYDSFLNFIFNYGQVEEKNFIISKDFNVTLRLLSSAENIEVSKALDNESSLLTKQFILKIETLSRSILKINGHTIGFSDSMIEEWKSFRNIKESPTEIEQKRSLLRYRIAPHLLNEMYDKYMELLKEQEDKFIELKKK